MYVVSTSSLYNFYATRTIPLTLYLLFAWTQILPDGKKGSFTANGRIERLDETTLLITELPVGKWTQDYKVSALILFVKSAYVTLMVGSKFSLFLSPH
jgi:hypothetical protein